MRKIIGGLIIGACALEVFSPSYVQSQDGNPYPVPPIDDDIATVIADISPAANSQYAAFLREKKYITMVYLLGAQINDLSHVQITNLRNAQIKALTAAQKKASTNADIQKDFLYIMEGVINVKFATGYNQYDVRDYCQAIAKANPKDTNLSYIPPVCRDYQVRAWRAKSSVTFMTSFTP